jgi:hypothetical protein
VGRERASKFKSSRVRGSETVEVVRVGKEVRRQWVLICSWTHGQRPTLPGGSAWYTSAGSDGVISEAVQETSDCERCGGVSTITDQSEAKRGKHRGGMMDRRVI